MRSALTASVLGRSFLPVSFARSRCSRCSIYARMLASMFDKSGLSIPDITPSCQSQPYCNILSLKRAKLDEWGSQGSLNIVALAYIFD
jgi:hypothetical protein